MNRLLSAIMAGSALALAACGGGGGGGGTSGKFIDGTASLGALINATCRIAAANNPGTTLTTARTDSRGEFRLEVPRALGAFLITCTGGQFFDEASGQYIANTEEIRTLAPSDRTSVGITPLTDVIAEAVLRAGGTITDDIIRNVAGQVGSFFGVSDPLAPPQVVRSASDLQNLSGDNAGVYAAVLAGLSDIGASLETGGNALTALRQLRTDVQDSRLGDQIRQDQIDAATNNRAAGTAAAGPAAANQSDPNRNRGNISTTGGAGTGGSGG